MVANKNECKHLNRTVIKGGTIACANPDCDILFPPTSEIDNKDYDYEKWEREDTVLIPINHHCDDICESDNLTVIGNWEKTGELQIKDLFYGTGGSHLTIRFCPFCGKRTRAMEMPKKPTIKQYEQSLKDYKGAIILESAPPTKIFEEE